MTIHLLARNWRGEKIEHALQNLRPRYFRNFKPERKGKMDDDDKRWQINGRVKTGHALNIDLKWTIMPM